jgi:hypothetical protein
MPRKASRAPHIIFRQGAPATRKKIPGNLFYTISSLNKIDIDRYDCLEDLTYNLQHYSLKFKTLCCQFLERSMKIFPNSCKREK